MQHIFTVPLYLLALGSPPPPTRIPNNIIVTEIIYYLSSNSVNLSLSISDCKEHEQWATVNILS